MRTLIDLSDPHLKQLTRLAKLRRVSRAQVVREAVAGYLERAPELQKRDDWIAAGFGVLEGTPLQRNGKRYADALDYERALRSEWGEAAAPVPLAVHEPSPKRSR